MNDETIFAKFIHFTVFLAICALIVLIGWREPLSYRFMSPEQITEVASPPPEPLPVTPAPVQSRPSRLEERPTSTRGTRADAAHSHR